MTAVEKPKTLGDILAYLDDIDNGALYASDADKALMGALLAAKIDNTAEVLSELEFQAERLRVAAAKLAEGKRHVLNKIECIKKYMAFHMQANGFQQIPGEVWKARLNTGLSVEPKREPTAEDQFTRTKYEWDKKALKAALEGLDPAAMEVAELRPSASVSIAVHKGKLLE